MEVKIAIFHVTMFSPHDHGIGYSMPVVLIDKYLARGLMLINRTHLQSLIRLIRQYRWGYGLLHLIRCATCTCLFRGK